MTTATRIAKTATATIEIKLTRTVSDDVSYSDGQNISTGRKVYENYEVKISGGGKEIRTSGKPGEFAFFAKQDRFSGRYPQGAIARIGDAYVGQASYDLAMSMIAELDAEVGKSEEQLAIETAKSQAVANYDAWYNSPEQIAYRKFEREMDRSNSDY